MRNFEVILFVGVLLLGMALSTARIFGALFSARVREKIRRNKLFHIIWLIAFISLFFPMFEAFTSHPLISAKMAKTQNEIAQIQTAILDYQTEYGVSPPANDNATLMKALEDNNPRRIAFLSLKSSDMNAQGEALDAWGTPLKITMTDPEHPIIQAAGPDRKWNTPDDMSVAKDRH